MNPVAICLALLLIAIAVVFLCEDEAAVDRIKRFATRAKNYLTKVRNAFKKKITNAPPEQKEESKLPLKLEEDETKAPLSVGIFNEQTAWSIDPKYQFDTEKSMSSRFGEYLKLPYIKSFDHIIAEFESIREYLFHEIIFDKKSDVTIPIKWLVQRDRAAAELKGSLKSAEEVYAEHIVGPNPRHKELRKLNDAAKKYLNQLQCIEASARDLLAVIPPEKRKLRPISVETPK